MSKRKQQAAPISVTPYFDKVQFWLRDPLNNRERAWLCSQCRPDGFYSDRQRSARFDSGFRERIELKGVANAGLQWLAARSEAHLNLIELAIDYKFDGDRHRDNLFEFFHRHLVRRFHRESQEVRCYRNEDGKAWREHNQYCAETRYDAGPGAANGIVLYKQESCRLNGEVGSFLHLEWRARGVRAVRGQGISSGVDLLAFNHRRFWQHNLLLMDISASRLGRLCRNLREGTKSRISTDIDARFGESLLRSYETVQEFLDDNARKYPVRRILYEIPNSLWLPA